MALLCLGNNNRDSLCIKKIETDVIFNVGFLFIKTRNFKGQIIRLPCLLFGYSVVVMFVFSFFPFFFTLIIVFVSGVFVIALIPFLSARGEHAEQDRNDDDERDYGKHETLIDERSDKGEYARDDERRAEKYIHLFERAYAF